MFDQMEVSSIKGKFVSLLHSEDHITVLIFFEPSEQSNI